MEKAQVNRCLVAGCPGACCQDMRLVYLAPEDRTKAFPDATKIDSWWELEDLPSGTYYTPQGSVYIKGRCPNLESDSNCRIYSQRPDACRNFEIGSRDCHDSRTKVNLPPVILISTIR